MLGPARAGQNSFTASLGEDISAVSAAPGVTGQGLLHRHSSCHCCLYSQNCYFSLIFYSFACLCVCVSCVSFSSPSSVCALSWVCVFLCSFCVSLLRSLRFLPSIGAEDRWQARAELLPFIHLHLLYREGGAGSRGAGSVAGSTEDEASKGVSWELLTSASPVSSSSSLSPCSSSEDEDFSSEELAKMALNKSMEGRLPSPPSVNPQLGLPSYLRGTLEQVPLLFLLTDWTLV